MRHAGPHMKLPKREGNALSPKSTQNPPLGPFGVSWGRKGHVRKGHVRRAMSKPSGLTLLLGGARGGNQLIESHDNLPLNRRVEMRRDANGLLL